jgi:hypothetical protein
MDSLARRLALSNVADLAMQQKKVEALVSALRHLDPIKKMVALGAEQRQFRCHGTYENHRQNRIPQHEC